MKRKKRSTEKFAATQFRPHGRAEMWSEDDIVYIEATGPFNPELVAALRSELGVLLAELPAGRRYGMIAIVRESLMASLETMKAFGEHSRRMTEMRFSGTPSAMVLEGEVEGGDLMLPRFARLYADQGRPFRSFDRLDEAQKWVREMLSQG